MCIQPDEYHLEETPIPDVIEVVLTEQTQAINEVIDLVSDSESEDPRLQVSSPSSHSIGFKEETLNSNQEDET